MKPISRGVGILYRALIERFNIGYLVTKETSSEDDNSYKLEDTTYQEDKARKQKPKIS